MANETDNTAKYYNLAGLWSVTIGDGRTYDMRIPGTLDESNIGLPDREDNEKNPVTVVEEEDPFNRLFTEELDLNPEEPEKEEPEEPAPIIMSRYTRKYTFEGAAKITKTITYEETPGKRLFLEVERARVLTLFIDGMEVPPFQAPSLATPHVFEVTGRLNGTHEVTFVSDNSYPGLPHDDIVSSNMASDETETNWNGLLGYVRIREENDVFVENIQVRPEGNALSVHLEISAPYKCETAIRLTSSAFTREYVTKIQIKEQYAGFVFDGLNVDEKAERWNENGVMHTLTVELQNGEKKTVDFGLRDFIIDKNQKFTMDGQVLFLRGETNSAVHPDTSYCPMDVPAWERIYKQYKSYGANFVRFASHCPPEAAFEAADRLGMLLMVGLSCHQHSGAYTTEEAKAYYRTELARILKTYGNHPSFVMMSFGSGAETCMEVPEFLDELLGMAKNLDHTRLYTPGANVISRNCDFVLVDDRGDLPEKVAYPVLTARTGMFEMLPDFNEIDLFAGVLLPNNLLKMRENVEREGMTVTWSKLVEAGGETAFRRYKREIEKCYLDERIAGVTLVGLTDYPGRGKPPVGMMNTHLVSKNYDFADPRRFAEFFAPAYVMADFKKFAYSYEETLSVPLYVMNYGKESLSYPLRVTLSYGDVSVEKIFNRTEVLPGEVKKIGELNVVLGQDMSEDRSSRKMVMTLRFGLLENRYPVFVYPSLIPMCPENVLEVSELNDAAIQYLNDGGNVFITPKVADRSSLGGRFIDAEHPVFKAFGSERFPDVNWENITNGAGFALPRRYKALVTKLTQPTDMTPVAELFETRVLNGAVMVSSLGLKEKMERPEVAALLSCIYDYMGSFEFSPNQEMRVQELREICDTLKD